MHRGNPVGDDRDPGRLAVALCELGLLGGEKRPRGDVGDDRQAAGEQLRSGATVLAAADRLGAGDDSFAERSLVDAPRPARELTVAEVVGLHLRDQLRPALDPHRRQPGAEQGVGVLGAQVEAVGPAAGAALAHHPLGDLQHRGRVERLARMAIGGAPPRRSRSLGAHAEGLATRCIDGLLERGADVVTPRDPAQRAGVIVARHPDPQRLFDICRERGVDIGAIGGVRVDPAGFNTAADIDRFLDCYDELSF